MKETRRPHAPFPSSVWLILLLLACGVLIYWRWFNFAIFSYGDWYYRFVPNLVELLQPTIWFNSIGIGTINELAWRSPLDFAFAIFSQVGAGLNVSEKFFIMWPLAMLSLVAPYLLVVQLVKNKAAAFLAALFYATNTYFLTINSQGHQLLVLGFNLLTLALAVFLKGLADNKLVYFILTALLLFMAGASDFRVWYIGMFLIIAFLIFFWPKEIYQKEKKKFATNLLLFFGIIFGLELYSLVSLGMSFSSQSGEAILGRSLFGSQYWNLPSAMTLDHPFWTGQDTSWFQVHPVNIYYWLIPLIAFSAFLIVKLKNKMVLFFGTMAVLGILLSKQISEPLANIYPFLFENFPGFSAFREATKFYYLILIGYMALIAIVFAKLYEKKAQLKPKQKLALHALTLAVVSLCIFNALPYITGSIQKITSPRQVPFDYALLEKQLSQTEQKEYFKTLWVPAQSRWSYYDTNHPRITAANLMSIDASVKGRRIDVPTQRDILDLIESKKFKDYLHAASVKYVVVPIRDIANQNDFYAFYGDSRQPYVNALSAVPTLKKVEAFKDLAVFENLQYTKGAYAFNNLYKLNVTSSAFDSTYDFLSSAIENNPNFTTEVSPSSPSAEVDDVFSDLQPKELEGERIMRNVPGNSTIYLNHSKANYSYTVSGNTLNLQKTNFKTLTTNSTLEIQANDPLTISSTTLSNTNSYYLLANNKLSPIDPAEQARNFGKIDGSAKIVSVNNQNLLKNGSFEEGPWQQSVSDCDAYDDNPSLKMNLNTTGGSQGSNYIDFWALRHQACTKSSLIHIPKGGDFVLSFNYKAPFQDQLAYRIISDKSPSKPTFFRIDSQVGGWRTVRQLVHLPHDDQNISIELLGLPPGVFSLNSRKTSFDNVSLSSAIVSEYQNTENTSSYERVEDSQSISNITNISYAPEYSPENLIKNPSLEDGLWQQEVGDCNNYDDNAHIGMRLSKTKASHGQASLELKAKTHVACTGPSSIPVTEGRTYLVNFKYASPNKSSAKYYIQFNDSDRTALSETLKTTNEWQGFYRVIRAPIGSNTMEIKVHAISDESGKTQAVNLYDEFGIYEVPDIFEQVYYVAKKGSTSTLPKKVGYNIVSPTKREILVSSARDPFYISFSDAYHAGWIINGAAEVNKTHFKNNGVFNAWYINPGQLCSQATICQQNSDGTYDIRIVAVFTPQRPFQISAWISLVTFILCSSFVLYSSRVLFKKDPEWQKSVRNR
ncbi:MAG: hypothetical protein WBP26_00245 [Candidatus Saccharimonadales bacterium]